MESASAAKQAQSKELFLSTFPVLENSGLMKFRLPLNQPRQIVWGELGRFGGILLAFLILTGELKTPHKTTQTIYMLSIQSSYAENGRLAR